MSTPERIHPLAAKLRITAVAQHGEAAIAQAEASARDAARRGSLELPEVRKARLAEERRESDYRRVSEYVRALKLPVRGELLEDVVRGKWQETSARAAVAAWLRGDMRVLALLGDIGTGKTTAISRAACVFAHARRSVAYIREPELVKLSQQRTIVAEERMERLRDVDLLIVDELGTTLTRDGEAAQDAIASMVDHRIAGVCRTALLGNFASATALAKAYGQRFADRLSEIGTVAEIAGTSMRGGALAAPVTEAGRIAARRLTVGGK